MVTRCACGAEQLCEHVEETRDALGNSWTWIRCGCVRFENIGPAHEEPRPVATRVVVEGTGEVLWERSA